MISEKSGTEKKKTQDENSWVFFRKNLRQNRKISNYF